MLHRFRRLIPVFVIGIAIAAIGNTPAHAATNQSQAITLSPASTDIAIDPGASLAKSMDIINGGNDTFNVALTTSPYHVSGESYDPQFTQLPGTVDASAWVHLSTTTDTVAGAKVVNVPYTITIPKNAAPGGYYAVIFAETSTNDTKTGVVSHNRVGNILYITVNGTIKSGGNITGDSIPFLHFSGPIDVGTKISNSGGTHFISNISYTVDDSKGAQVFKATFDRYILPQTEREIKSSFTPESLVNIYTVHRSATIAGIEKDLPDQKVLVINPWFLLAVAFLLGILIGIPIQRARQRSRAQRK